MAIKIGFDNSNVPITPVVVLATKSGKRLGALPAYNIIVRDCMNDASEISFSVNKNDFTKTGKAQLWDQVVDFKTVWIKEWNRFFEVTVTTNDSAGVEKVVTGKALGQSELSQINLYKEEINSPDDIEREDYVPSILYNPENPNASILHRILRKAPHYNIAHVDKSIANIQRTFSFDKKDIKNCFDDIAKEIDCLFVYNCYLDDNDNIARDISVYDLEDFCTECSERGTLQDKCRVCGSSKIIRGYGMDTNIFVSSSNLADEISLSNNTSSVKNCFKLQGGDDLMSATIAGCNPDGSSYLWFISDAQKSEMSAGLTKKLNAYNTAYNYYCDDYRVIIPSQAASKYNSIVNRYSCVSDDIQPIPSTVYGYSSIIRWYYDTIDLISFLEHSMMPSAKTDSTDAKKEAAKLTQESLVGAAVEDRSKLSLTTASNAVLGIAKIVADSSKYQIKIVDASLTEYVWKGSFSLKSYSNEDDTAKTELISVVISDNYEKFVKQKIDTVLMNASKDSVDLVVMFKMSDADFLLEMKKYSLSMLKSFYESCQAALNILIGQGASDKNAIEVNGNTYEKLYIPMRTKCGLIEDEIKRREAEIAAVKNVQGILDKQRRDIQSALNMQEFLGADLWIELMSYRREDIYQNSNYISDSLDNAELVKRAIEFIDIAKKDIFKSALAQYSISASLRNLLVMKEFKPIVDSFEVGNWIRVSVDGIVYKLRLVEYQIDFENISEVSVVFSDVNTTVDGISDIKSVLSQASSMASSYNFVARQATKGAKGSNNLDKIFQDGISVSDIDITDGKDRQNQVWDKNGMLFREYDQVQERYTDEQMRIINSTISMTDDNWETTKTAIGKFFYLDPMTQKSKHVWGVNGELIAGKLLVGESLGIYNKSGSLSFDGDGLTVKNRNNTVSINPNSRKLFNIANASGDMFTFDDNGNLIIVGDITAKNLVLSDGVTIGADRITGLSAVAESGDYADLNNTPDLSGIKTNEDNIKANAANISNLLERSNVVDAKILEMLSVIEALQQEIELLKKDVDTLKGSAGGTTK